MKSKTSKKADHSSVVDALSHLLADTYVLYTKTQNFHWNVKGPLFYSYHKMFEAQYEELSEAIDTLAERIRSLHQLSPASMAEFLKLTSLKESSNSLHAEMMVKTLLADHETIAKNIEKLFAVIEDDGDEVTLDLFIERKAAHDKTAWMLRSILGH